MSLYEQIKELEAVKDLCVTILSAKADADNEFDQSKPYYKELRTAYEACAIVDAPKIAEACLTLLNNLPSVLSALKGQEPIVWHGLDEDPGQVWVFAWGPDVCIGLEYDRNPQELAHDGYTKWCLAEGRIPTPPEGVSL